jgi:hypothetical protein
VRVGRAALDEDAIRLIEEHNPRVEFDWTRILKGQGDPGEPAETPQRKAPLARPGRPPAPAERRTAPPEQPPPVPAAAAAGDGEGEPEDGAADADSDVLAGVSVSDGSDQETAGVVTIGDDRPPTPAQARLGSEGLLRLRGRYADILAGINDRVPEGPQREELKAQAERLDPDTWVTDEEVRLGLEQYETVFESLRSVAGRRRRRRRRRPGNPL